MSGLFSLLCVISSVLLVIAVVIQNSKGGGLSTAFGAANISSMIGAKRGNDMIEKITWGLISSLMAFAFLASITMTEIEVNTKEFRLKADDIENQMNTTSIPSAPAEQQQGQPTGQPDGQ